MKLFRISLSKIHVPYEDYGWIISQSNNDIKDQDDNNSDDDKNKDETEIRNE